MSNKFRVLPGVALSLALAGLAMLLGREPWFGRHGLSALTLAIALGMIVGNTVYGRVAAPAAPGVAFSKQWLLRAGVVLYGLRLTFQDVARVGSSGVLIDTLVLGSTFALAWWLGRRWLELDWRTCILIGAGSSICGAAAVMATEPVVRARSEQVTVAVATVVVFGTLAMFLYPALFLLNRHWPFIAGGVRGFGVYTGSTVHEVAQVVAAARSIDPAAADTAVITKMVRVMMLAPVLMGLSAYLGRGSRQTHGRPARGNAQARGIVIPWFAVAFIGVIAANSLIRMPVAARAWIGELDTVLLATAMAALGLTTHAGALRNAGARPLILALALFLWLVLGGAMINHVVVMVMR